MVFFSFITMKFHIAAAVVKFNNYDSFECPRSITIVSAQGKSEQDVEREKGKVFCPIFSLRKVSEDSHMSYVLRSCVAYVYINFSSRFYNYTCSLHLHDATRRKKLRAENSSLCSSINSLSFSAPTHGFSSLCVPLQPSAATRLSINASSFVSRRALSCSELTKMFFCSGFSYVHELPTVKL